MYLFSHIRNQYGHIVATLAINKNLSIGGMFRNPKDKISRKRGLQVAALRADQQKTLTVPERWVTPQMFAKNKQTSSLPLTDLLEVPLVALVEQEVKNLEERAKRYFK